MIKIKDAQMQKRAGLIDLASRHFADFSIMRGLAAGYGRKPCALEDFRVDYGPLLSHLMSR
jgi:hypothetical protein